MNLSGSSSSKREDLHHVSSGRTLVVLFVILPAVLYIALLAVSHVDAFRVYVRDQVQAFIGWPVEIERAHLSPGLNLVLEGVANRDGLIAGQPGFQAQRVRVAVSLLDLWRHRGSPVRRLEAENVYWSLARDESGMWQPAFFARVTARLGAWLGCEDFGIKDSAEESAFWWAVCPVRLRGGRVIVYGPRETLAEWLGLEWETDVFELGSNTLLFRRVKASHVTCSPGVTAHNARVEFLQIRDRTVVLRCELGAGTESPPAASKEMGEPADERSVLSEAWRRARGGRLAR